LNSHPREKNEFLARTFGSIAQLESVSCFLGWLIKHKTLSDNLDVHIIIALATFAALAAFTRPAVISTDISALAAEFPLLIDEWVILRSMENFLLGIRARKHRRKENKEEGGLEVHVDEVCAVDGGSARDSVASESWKKRETKSKDNR